ncbi:MAG TPA: glycosyltransferase, partial [Methanosarcina sp.]|nr:glycosyltransferase [Methanosarcina sp.]
IGLIERLFVPANRIFVVSNTAGSDYFLAGSQSPESNKLESTRPMRILTMSALYPHKRLELIPEVCKHLIDDHGYDQVEFLLTLSPDSIGWKSIRDKSEGLGVADKVKTLGLVKVKDGPSVYLNADLVFLPSILETFSANYPEAMAIGRPIVTSDLSFARNICQDAALYFEAGNAREAARKIAEVLADSEKYAILVQRGKSVLRSFPNAQQKYELYKRILQDLAVT